MAGRIGLWLGPEGGRFSLILPAGGAKMAFANWKTPAGFDTESPGRVGRIIRETVR